MSDALEKRKPGRPRKSEATPGEGDLAAGRYRGKRNNQISLSEVIRDSLDPLLIRDYWMAVARGVNPVIEETSKGARVIPDPNPMSPAPTLEQKNRAIQELTNRGWGLPVQSIQMDMNQKVVHELSPELLQGVNYLALAKIREALQLTNVIDAELVEVELQETSQVENPALLLETGELQEPDHNSE